MTKKGRGLEKGSREVDEGRKGENGRREEGTEEGRVGRKGRREVGEGKREE